MADIIEVRSLTSTSVSADGSLATFIIKRSFTDAGSVRFGLYVLALTHGREARKLLESSYLADLSRHPGTDRWSVRADLGEGVQLYDFDASGKVYPLVTMQPTGLVGTWLGLQAGLDVPHQTGVLSYEWAPDGAALWYSRFRLRSASEVDRVVNAGLVYDDRLMTDITPRSSPGLLLGIELRVVAASGENDRLVGFAPTNAAADLGVFSRAGGTAWQPDSRSIRYPLETTGADGQAQVSTTISDVTSGLSRELPPSLMASALDQLVTLSSGRFLTVKRIGSGKHLLAVASGGTTEADYGEVAYWWLNGDDQAWPDRARKQRVLGVRYADRNGLIVFPDSPANRTLSKLAYNLSNCDFAPSLMIGVCVRDSLTVAPELVSISIPSGKVRTILSPNAAYGEINPLTSERAIWTNCYGHASTGYITFPRGYVVGRRYPTIVVTHGTDAQNRFAYDGFQWEFPLQVLAERGYLILSVNESRATLEERVLFQERIEQARELGPRKVQFNLGLDAVATMDAALQDAMDRGIANPEETGIAGYSRGAEVVTYVLSQSKLFKAGVVGDGGADIEGYWMSRAGRAWYRSLYGGSPLDSDVRILESYRRFAPPFRAKEFAGPLLQIYTSETILGGYELNGLLQEAGVPTELVYFPNESHVFWHPVRRMSAMRRTIEWLDFWLRGMQDTDSQTPEQYSRWDAMKRHKETLSGRASGPRN